MAAGRQRGVDHGALERARGSRSPRRVPATGRRRAKLHVRWRGPTAALAAPGPPRRRGLTGESPLFHLFSSGQHPDGLR